MQDTLQYILEFPLLKVRQYNITIFDVLILIFILSAARLLIWVIQKFLRRRIFPIGNVDAGRQFALTQLIKYIIYLLAILFSFQALSIDISLLLAGSAALLVGVGLGLQQTFNDLVSGLILLFEGNVSVGDIIEIDNLIGRVTAIGIRTSKVETRDAITIIVPNSKFIVDNVINWSHSHLVTRFSVRVHTSYQSDPELVRRVLLDCLLPFGDVASTPVPFVRLNHFGESSLDFELLFWTDNMWRIENMKSEIRFNIYRAFKENDIRVPFPQRDVYIHTAHAEKPFDFQAGELKG
ncbi:MAG: mechanosensitive ion channel [Ferruginibacter sp.]|nr:mechanosensitive ion channel [Cytophagales bacterium]